MPPPKLVWEALASATARPHVLRQVVACTEALQRSAEPQQPPAGGHVGRVEVAADDPVASRVVVDREHRGEIGEALPARATVALRLGPHRPAGADLPLAAGLAHDAHEPGLVA